MMTSSNILPVVTVQPTLGEVVQEVKDGVLPFDKFWVSCYKAGEPSVHAQIRVELDEVDRDLPKLIPESQDTQVSVVGSGKSGYEYKVSCTSLGIPEARILLPLQEYIEPERAIPTRPHRITAFDVSPDTSRFATGFLDGSVILYPSTHLPTAVVSFVPQKITGWTSKVYSRPHLSGITSLKFFPSSRVLLSSGLDFSLSILPADLPVVSSTVAHKIEPVRTMRGHKRPVTATSIIGAGRNVVSCSLDGTVKLWDVPSGSTISTLSTRSSSFIQCMSLGDNWLENPDGQPALAGAGDDREVPEVQNKVVFCGLENGTFEVLDLSAKKSTYQSPASSAERAALEAVMYSSPLHLLATGSAAGVVKVYDVRSLGTPLSSFARKEGEIQDLEFLASTQALGLAIATSDGLPFVANLTSDGSIRADELIGADCDPVRRIRVRGGASGEEVWTSSDDGVVRRYVYSEKQ